MQQMSTAEHSRRLALLAQAFTGALEPSEVIDIVVQQGMAGLHSSGGVLALIDNGLVTPICTAGTAHDALNAFGPLWLDHKLPLTTAARENIAVWVSSREEAKARFPLLGESSATPSQAWAAIPLVAHGTPFGVLGLSFLSPFEFAEPDRLFLTTLAHITALKLSSWTRLHAGLPDARRDPLSDRTVEPEPTLTITLKALTNSAALPADMYNGVIGPSDLDRELRAAVLAADVEGAEVALLDHLGVIVAVNEAWEQFSRENGGRSESCGVGVSYLDICDRAGRDVDAFDMGRAVRGALRGDCTSAAVLDVPCHSPEIERWFDQMVTTRLDAGGAPCGAVVTVVPAAQRLKIRSAGVAHRRGSGSSEPDTPTVPAYADQRLPANSPRPLSDLADSMVWSVLETAPDGMVVTDHSGLIRAVNRQVENMFGYERADLLGRRVEVLLPERFRSVHSHHRASYTADPVVRHMGEGRDLWARRADRSVFPVDVSLSPIEEQGQAAIIASIRDVTDRFEAQRRLHETETLFRTLFESAPVGMFTTRRTDEGNQVFDRVNFAFCTMVGSRPEDLLGRNIDDLISPDPITHGPQVADDLSVVSATERRYRRPDGTYGWALLHSGEIHMSGEERMLSHVLDITERRTAEAERDRHDQWLVGLADIRNHLLADGPLDVALDMACRHALDIAQADLAVVGSTDPTKEFLTLQAVHGDLKTDTARLSIDSAIRAVLDSGEPVVLEEPPVDADEDLKRTIGPSILIPLVTDQKMAGVLLVGRRPGLPAFDPVAVRVAASFAHEVNAALLMARSRSDRQRLALLEDRYRIARDLHDVVIQRLFAAGMGLESVASAVSPTLADRITLTVDELDLSISELRSAIFNLSRNGTASITGNLEALLAVHSRRLGFSVDLTVLGELDALDPVVAEQLLPSLNEALSNVVRHAHATRVEVTITKTDHQLVLEVQDDGKGLSTARRPGEGLRNLRDRALRLGGVCTITNITAGGAKLTWQVEI